MPARSCAAKKQQQQQKLAERLCVCLYVCVAGWVGEVESFYKPLSNSREKRTLASGRGWETQPVDRFSALHCPLLFLPKAKTQQLSRSKSPLSLSPRLTPPPPSHTLSLSVYLPHTHTHTQRGAPGAGPQALVSTFTCWKLITQKKDPEACKV